MKGLRAIVGKERRYEAAKWKDRGRIDYGEAFTRCKEALQSTVKFEDAQCNSHFYIFFHHLLRVAIPAMSRAILNSGNTRLLSSLICPSSRLPPPAIPQSSAIRIRLRRPLPYRLSIRNGSSAAAVASVPEEDHETGGLETHIGGEGSSQADQHAIPARIKEVPVSLLPPELLERIEKKAAQWDEQQAMKSQAKRERKQEFKDKKERRRPEREMRPQRAETTKPERQTRPVAVEAPQAEEATPFEETSGEILGKRTGDKARWTDEQKAAMKVLKARERTTSEDGKEGWKDPRRNVADAGRLKEWIRKKQDEKAALVLARAPPKTYTLIDAAIKQATATGRIPTSKKTSTSTSSGSRVGSSKRDPTSRSKDSRTPARTLKREGFSSSFFSEPTFHETNNPTPSSSKTPPANSATPSSRLRSKPLPPDAPSWKVQNHSLREKFGEQGWSPRRKLSPDAQRGIRDLHAQNPDVYSTPVLAESFKVSPEAIRRILRSKWMDRLANSDTPDTPAGDVGSREKKLAELRERWAKRHDRIWDQKSELGLLPKRRRERKADSGEQGLRRVEEGLYRKEVLERARREESGMAFLESHSI